MSLGPHTIEAGTGRQKPGKRVGRGNASGKGTSAAKGTKGQRARSGGRRGMARRSFKKTLQKMKKLRGFTSMHEKPALVTLATLERVSSPGELITVHALIAKGVVPNATRSVKIVSTGQLTKKISVQGCLASQSALTAIEKAGGTWNA